MNIPISQGFDTNIVNTQQSFRPARKNKTLAEIKEIQQSLVNNSKDIKDPRVDRIKKALIDRYFGDCNSGDNSWSTTRI